MGIGLGEKTSQLQYDGSHGKREYEVNTYEGVLEDDLGVQSHLWEGISHPENTMTDVKRQILMSLQSYYQCIAKPTSFTYQFDMHDPVEEELSVEHG